MDGCLVRPENLFARVGRNADIQAIIRYGCSIAELIENDGHESNRISNQETAALLIFSSCGTSFFETLDSLWFARSFFLDLAIFERDVLPVPMGAEHDSIDTRMGAASRSCDHLHRKEWLTFALRQELARLAYPRCRQHGFYLRH